MYTNKHTTTEWCTLLEYNNTKVASSPHSNGLYIIPVYFEMKLHKSSLGNLFKMQNLEFFSD